MPEKVDLLVAVGNLGKLIGQGAIEAGLDPQRWFLQQIMRTLPDIKRIS